MRIFKKNNTEIDQDLKMLENKMREYLHPVPPRKEFVSSLYQRLMASDMLGSQGFFTGPTSRHLLVAGGIIGSILIVITSIRGLLSLLGMVGFLVQYFQRNSRGQQVKPA
jgi:hypothetical protein